MFSKISSKLFLATILLLSVSAFAQKGKPSPCVKPTVAPPDTSCNFGPGCRDSSFNGTGFAYYDVLGAIKWVSSLPDGKIVAVSEGPRFPDSPTGSDLRIMRFNPDGSLDTTFGEVDTGNPLLQLGYKHIAITDGNETVTSGLLQPDGKIIAGGWSSVNNIRWVARFLPDGTPDESFDADGIRTFSITDVIQELALQPDGKIVIGRGPNFTITRLNTDGSLDNSFGSGGSVTYNPSLNSKGSGHIWSIAFQRLAATPTEDRIVIGGWSNERTTGTVSFALMRIGSTGALDTAFGSGGRVKTSFFNTGDQVRELAIDPFNRIVAAGITRINSCSATDFGIARYTENGHLDTSFGIGGKASLDLYNDENAVYALTVQPDGKPVIGGNARVLFTDPVNRRGYFVLVRFDTSGNLDSSFGPGSAGPGVVTTELTGSSSSSYIFSLHHQSDGRILAGGVSPNKPALARYFR